MNSSATQAQARLDAWREQGADRMDPVRFRFIEALAGRAARYSGEVRRVLETRLSELLEVYADDLASTVKKASDSGSAASPCAPARSALAELVDYIASHASTRGNGPATANAESRPSSYPDLPVLDDFREMWSKISTERQLRQSLAQVPGNAGPLNSSSLVHRSLSLMHELSPGYLRQFLSYVDALSWMEQMAGSIPAGKHAPRAGKGGDTTKKARRAAVTR